ncbi:MAG TPA: aldo/keto reductase [Myxococcota bacterium]|nr:aldo/keto reductase [Myxococcota bacterium]
MERVVLGRTGLQSSRLGFGCASMMGRVGRRRSLRALCAAFDSGVSYFDVARSYGYGEAESVLGEFLRGRRDRVVVATKAGISSSRPTAFRRTAKTVARSVFRLVPGLRLRVRSHLGVQFAANLFSPEQLRASVDESLQQLCTDYVDVLHLHDCSLATLDDDALFAESEALVASGKVRHLGVATNIAVVHAALRRRGGTLSVVQFPYSLVRQEAGPLVEGEERWREVAKVAYQPFGGELELAHLRARLSELAVSPRMPSTLREKLQNLDRGALADAALSGVLRGTRVDVAICSMLDPEHVRYNVAAMQSSRFSDEDIALLRRSFRGGDL